MLACNARNVNTAQSRDRPRLAGGTKNCWVSLLSFFLLADIKYMKWRSFIIIGFNAKHFEGCQYFEVKFEFPLNNLYYRDMGIRLLTCCEIVEWNTSPNISQFGPIS